MSKIGVSLSIDVTAIIKEHMLKHQNGKTYLDMTVFIDPGTEDNYGNHGMIVQNWKDAMLRCSGVNLVINSHQQSQRIIR